MTLTCGLANTASVRLTTLNGSVRSANTSLGLTEYRQGVGSRSTACQAVGSWACLLVYNQIRTVIAQAASQHGKRPSNIRFKRALRTVESFRSALAVATPSTLPQIYECLFHAIVSRQIGDRPGREEPRRVKRRLKPYPRLTQPCNKAQTTYREKG